MANNETGSQHGDELDCFQYGEQENILYEF